MKRKSYSKEQKVYIVPRPINGLRGVKITPASAQSLCNEYGYIDIDKACKMRDNL